VTFAASKPFYLNKDFAFGKRNSLWVCDSNGRRNSYHGEITSSIKKLSFESDETDRLTSSSGGNGGNNIMSHYGASDMNDESFVMQRKIKSFY
jgi:hypothetical protein